METFGGNIYDFTWIYLSENISFYCICGGERVYKSEITFSLTALEILHRALNHSSQGPNVKDITNGNHPKKFVIVEEEKLVPKKSFISFS